MRRHFCAIRGIKSFYLPRSNSEGFSVNTRCLDRRAIARIHVTQFDGCNWEAHAAALAHHSRDE